MVGAVHDLCTACPGTRYPPPYAPTATVLYRTAIVHARSSYRPRPPPPRPTHLQKRSERELTDPEHAVAEKRGSPAPLPPETRPHRTGPDRLELSKHPRPSPTTLDDRYTHPFGSRTRAALLLASLIISLNPLASYHMPAVVASAFPAISIGPPQIRVQSSPSALPKLGSGLRWRSGPCSGRGDRGLTHAGPTSYC